MKQVFWVFLILLFLSSCQEETKTGNSILQKKEIRSEETKEVDSSLHYALNEFGLVDISTLDSSIRCELRYATRNNFMHTILYDTLRNVFLQKDVAERLVKCQKLLKDSMPEYSLLVYDGVRPLDVQRSMWKALDSIPPALRGRFVSNPSYGSVHNYGAAVDITICDADGIPLDMGAGYDDFREIAFPSLEWKFIQSGELTKEQLANRKLLRWVMKSEGFRNIPSEWWHFNACSRQEAASKYQRLNF